ncbi:MAG: chromosome segregation protein SMC, partial [Peptostreptococcus sp.]|nr:chromosome segregation protein SMC [Peptostreptococcus sp.]
DKAYQEKRKAELELEAINEEMESNKALSLDILEKKQELSANFATSQANLDNLRSSRIGLEEKVALQEEEIRDLEKYLEGKNTGAGDLLTKMEALDKDLDQARASLGDLEKNISQLAKNDRNLNMDLGRIKSRRNTYIDMENHHEGFNKGVREILKNKSLEGICGALGELIRVPAKYEKAIEASLGAAIQNVVVEDESVAKRSIEYLKKSNLGRVTFLPKTTMRSNKLALATNTGVRPLGLCSDLVEFDEAYRKVVESLLGRVILIDNMTDAIAYAKETGHRFKLVTLDGDILNPGGSMTGGSLKNSGNILSRKRLIDELGQEIESIEEQINQCKSEFDLLGLEKDRLSDQAAKIREKKETLSKEIIGANTEIKLAEAKLRDRRHDLDNSKEEITRIDRQIEKNQADFDQCKDQLEALDREGQGNMDLIQSLSDSLNEAKEKHDICLKLFNDKNLDLVRAKQIFENNLAEVERIESGMKKSQEN